MPLPTSRPSQQLSIRSFFQSPKTTQYDAPTPPPPRPSQSLGTSLTSSSPTETSKKPPPPPLPPPPPSRPVTSKTNPNLPRQATIRPIQQDDIVALRRLHSLLLPIAFPDSFYQAVLDPAQSHRFSRVIVWSGADDGDDGDADDNLSQAKTAKVVGAVVCIPEPSTGSPILQSIPPAPPTTLYIRSLGILAPYRSLGLVNAALDDILAHAVSHAAPAPTNLRSVTAHVWTENDAALQWYLRRGFERQGDAISGYYRRLRPDSAYLVSRPVRDNSPASSGCARPTTKTPSAAVAASTAASEPAARPSPPVKGQSFQNQRPEMEWNDLPADMMVPPSSALSRRTVAGVTRSEPVSGASSRSSSSAAHKKKRDRSYPAAAFGNF